MENIINELIKIEEKANALKTLTCEKLARMQSEARLSSDAETDKIMRAARQTAAQNKAQSDSTLKRKLAEIDKELSDKKKSLYDHYENNKERLSLEIFEQIISEITGEAK